MFNSFPIPKPDSGGSNIKSRQSGTVTYTTQNTTIAISPVDLTKAIVRISYTVSGPNNAADFFLMAKFTSNSQISIECDNLNTLTKVVSWEVIEFNNVKSLQSGQTTNIATGIVNVTTTVSPVNTGKSMLFFSMRTTSGGTGLAASFLRGEVTNSTTLTFSINHNAAGGVDTFQYYLIEFN